METLKIKGGKRLEGETIVQGAKNSALPILSAAVLGRNCIIHNCPNLKDTKTALKILNCLGIKTKFSENCVETWCDGELKCSHICDNLMKEMRSSVVFLGAILSKCKEAHISYPGGCSIGKRPIDLHLKAFEKMGVKILEENGEIRCFLDKINDTKIHFDFPSVGATENIILLSAVSDAEIEIENGAMEPEILDLISFINSMGGNIHREINGRIFIKGVKALGNTEYKVMPDRIAALTYLSGICACSGRGIVKNVRPEHMRVPLDFLRKAGSVLEIGDDFIEIKSPKRPNSFGVIETNPYPAFPTDAQAIFMASAIRGRGESCFIENIFEDRFGHIKELRKLGSTIEMNGNVACVTGRRKLSGETLYAKDLRGGAALVIGALSSRGESEIRNIGFIDRGYENIERSFSDFGAEIVREKL